MLCKLLRMSCSIPGVSVLRLQCYASEAGVQLLLLLLLLPPLECVCPCAYLLGLASFTVALMQGLAK